jgi:hypothetical protein
MKKRLPKRNQRSRTDSKEEKLLVAQGKMLHPKETLDARKLDKIPTGKVKGNRAVQALLADREEGW